MSAADQKKLDLPTAGADPATSEPLIFTMPERYRGGKTPMAEPKKEESKPAPKPAPPPAPTPKPPPLPLGQKPLPKKKSNTKVLVIAGVLVLIALGLTGFFLLQTLQKPATPPEQTVALPPPPTGGEEEEEGTEGEEGAGTTEPTEPFPANARPGTDSDSDGLTDVEEQTIYTTDPFLPDTDADGFLDGNEVFHRYNPNGTAPGTLETAGLVKSYDAATVVAEKPLPYGILYPAVWSASVLDIIKQDYPWNATFTAPSGEFVTVVISEKDAVQTLASWLSASEVDPTTLRSTVTKNGLAALVTEDQLTAYVDGGAFVATVHYDLGIKGTIDYLQTFQMMLNSLTFP